ncbi:hypothetical protein C8R47DRAFT_1163769 [Mycena vitilis]|nr:hypothetical protein C8R47DRAFT_1163769 [Mycena vitilis]
MTPSSVCARAYGRVWLRRSGARVRRSQPRRWLLTGACTADIALSTHVIHASPPLFESDLGVIFVANASALGLTLVWAVCVRGVRPHPVAATRLALLSPPRPHLPLYRDTSAAIAPRRRSARATPAGARGTFFPLPSLLSSSSCVLDPGRA